MQLGELSKFALIRHEQEILIISRKPVTSTGTLTTWPIIVITRICHLMAALLRYRKVNVTSVPFSTKHSWKARVEELSDTQSLIFKEAFKCLSLRCMCKSQLWLLGDRHVKRLAHEITLRSISLNMLTSSFCCCYSCFFLFSTHLGPDGVFWRTISAFTTLPCLQVAWYWSSLKNAACCLILSVLNVKRKKKYYLNSNESLSANLFCWEKIISIWMLKSCLGDEITRF